LELIRMGLDAGAAWRRDMRALLCLKSTARFIHLRKWVFIRKLHIVAEMTKY
jgi:hypothetical protein